MAFLCNELTGDELTVWWDDRVTSWLVAKTDATDVVSEASFYVATSFPIFWLKYWIKDAGIKNAGILDLIFKPQVSDDLKLKFFLICYHWVTSY